MTVAVVGIFVGGRSSRMGGKPKGLLRHPRTGTTLVEYLVSESHEAGLLPVLVGAAAAYSAVAPGVERIADEPLVAGPAGGLIALARRAQRVSTLAIAVACDMPHVRASDLANLAELPRGPDVLACRCETGALWEAFCARYEPDAVLAAFDRVGAAGSMQRFLASLRVEEPPAGTIDVVAFDDWDTEEDRMSN